MAKPSKAIDINYNNCQTKQRHAANSATDDPVEWKRVEDTPLVHTARKYHGTKATVVVDWLVALSAQQDVHATLDCKLVRALISASETFRTKAGRSRPLS